jgi:hypothetical protein
MQKLFLALPLFSLVLGASITNAYTAPKPLSPFGQTILLTDAAVTSNNNSAAFAGSILSVDPATGARTLFSDLTQTAQGPLGKEPTGIAVLSSLLGLGNRIEVTDPESGTNMQGAVFQIDPQTGIRSILSDFGNSAQGPLGADPISITTTDGLLGLGAGILVLDDQAGTGQHGAFFGVNTLTGQRVILSDFGNSAQGPSMQNPLCVVAASGLLGQGTSSILVVDSSGGTNGLGAVYSVNIFGGTRTLLSDFGNTQQGPLGADPEAVACAPQWFGFSDKVFVLDRQAGTNQSGAIFMVTSNGQRTLLSDLGNSSQGYLGNGDARQIAIGPNNTLLVTDNAAGTNGQGALIAVDANSGKRTLVSDFGNSNSGPAEGVASIGIVVWPNP